MLGVRCDPGFQILDVERMVEIAHLLGCCLFAMVYFDVFGEVVIIDETVHHFHPLRFHRMFFTELIFGDVFVIEVAHLSHVNL